MWSCGAALLLAVCSPRQASAEDDAAKSACLQAYESSQLHRRRLELQAARQDLRTCASEACPAIARTDCVQWLAEVDAAVPSVVFEATLPGGPVFDVTVKVDGIVRSTQLDGRPVEVDPGVHTFTFERAGNPTQEQRIIIRAAEKNRMVTADWAARASSASGPAAPVPMERPVPALVYVVAAVGVAGLADFAVAGGLGLAKKQALQSTQCAPFCSSSDVGGIKTLYAVADVGLAVGVVALVTSGILFLVRPERPVRSALPTSLLLAPTQSGGVVGWRGVF